MTERPWHVIDRVGGNLLAVFATEAEARDFLRRVQAVNPDMPEDEVTVEFSGVEPKEAMFGLAMALDLQGKT